MKLLRAIDATATEIQEVIGVMKFLAFVGVLVVVGVAVLLSQMD